MNIESRTSHGENIIPIETRLLSQRWVYLEGEITMKAVMEVSKQLVYLSRVDSQLPIYLNICSEGGGYTAGAYLYDLMTTIKAPIYTVCNAMAYSMGAIIFASNKKGRRLIYPHSELMFHQGYLESNSTYTQTDMHQWAEKLAKHELEIARWLAKSIEKPEKQIINDLFQKDRYFSEKEAIEYGLADRVITAQEIMEVKNI